MEMNLVKLSVDNVGTTCELCCKSSQCVKGGAHLTSVSSLSIVELSLQLGTKLPTIIIIGVVGDNETDENAKGLSGKNASSTFSRPLYCSIQGPGAASLGCLTYTSDAELGLVFTSHQWTTTTTTKLQT